MRNYALTLAQPSLSTGLIPAMIQSLKTTLLRRKIRKVLLNNGTCPLTGLAGANLRQLLALPISCDIAIEIERIKFLAARDWSAHAASPHGQRDFLELRIASSAWSAMLAMPAREPIPQSCHNPKQ
jgi:hypothetical protein